MRTFVTIENLHSTTYVDINTVEDGKNAGYSDVFVARDTSSIPTIRNAIAEHLNEVGGEGVFFTGHPNEFVALENVGNGIEAMLRN